MPSKDSGFSRFGLVLLACLTLGWGLNWPIMKIVLWDVPPLTFRGVCLLTGALGVLLIGRIAGQSLTVPRRYWPQLLLLAACNTLIWNVCVIYGVALLPSGRAALLGYTMPLWSALLSIWLLNDRLTPRRIAALVLGMAGVYALMGPEMTRLGEALAGVGLMLTAAVAWAFGVVLLKRFAIPVPTVSLTGWLMFAGGVPIAVAALLLEPDQWRPVGLYPALGVVYNIVVAFMFCYWAWNRIVLMVPIAVSSLSSLVTPMIGVVSGALLLGEELSWRELVAAALILASIALVLRTSPAPAPRPRDAPVV
jgi:drug/metabolite transporter (DMT)-like permease